MENQVLDGRYVLKHKLFNLLDRLFPTKDYTVEVHRSALIDRASLSKEQEKGGNFVLTAPKKLTQVSSPEPVQTLDDPKTIGREAMAPLKEELQNLRCESSDPRSSFVPEGALDTTITVEKIKSALRDVKVRPDRVKETLDLIVRGGKKTFAILVSIYRTERIVDFIEIDQLQGCSIDSKLPYSSRTDLERILPKADAADFFEKQWEFTAPIFKRQAGHRCLHERTIFPFLESSIQGEGNFGYIFKIGIHPCHSQAALRFQGHPHRTVVRKELKVKSPSDTEDFKRECRVLSFLNCLEHPNIVELLGSYTHQGVHNLIFPLAEYDLHKLLQGGTSPSFKSELDYLFALCGLASALDRLHTFCFEELDITLIGCHHDLRPHNILVEDRALLLADFGLSNLKEISEGSKSVWKKGDSRYLAPECEDVDHNFMPGLVGRKSDMWSFGCVLAELVTYIMQGPGGVVTFEGSRKVILAERLTVQSFHAGRAPNKGVDDWLAAMDKTASSVCRRLISLVRDLLQMNPESRPNANQVTHRLRFEALIASFDSANNALSGIAGNGSQNIATTSVLKLIGGQTHQNLDMLIEKARLASWAQTVGLFSQTGDKNETRSLLTADDAFHRTFHNLKKIEQEIASSVEAHDAVDAKVVKLRMINDDLIQLLPGSSQEIIRRSLENKLLSTDDWELLEHIQQTFDEASRYRSISTLAAVRYMHHLCEAPVDGYGRRMLLKNVIWKPQKAFDYFSIGNLTIDDRAPKLVLVETIRYADYWVNAVGDELYNRVGAVAELLRTASRSDRNIRLLSPVGYFHEPIKRVIRLVFEIPGTKEGGKDGALEVTTLWQYMQARSSLAVPALEDRFQLARRLASTLSRLHKVKWLHKNISAFTIIFSTLRPPGTSDSGIPLPYAVGFNYSRPNDPKSISVLPEYRIEVMDYCHPEYSSQANRVRFQPRFDWYSLGLVLLEIGLWRTLGSMTKGKQGMSPKALLDHILQHYVPRLDFFMGRGYRKVVMSCLNGEVERRSIEEDDDGAKLERYDQMQTVEEQLASCSIHP
ncbi:MAG: hypothetical protein Q9170_001346 [Blastenia crenularia]